jgi:hypothetical protein
MNGNMMMNGIRAHRVSVTLSAVLLGIIITIIMLPIKP